MNSIPASPGRERLYISPCVRSAGVSAISISICAIFSAVACRRKDNSPSFVNCTSGAVVVRVEPQPVSSARSAPRTASAGTIFHCHPTMRSSLFEFASTTPGEGERGNNRWSSRTALTCSAQQRLSPATINRATRRASTVAAQPWTEGSRVRGTRACIPPLRGGGAIIGAERQVLPHVPEGLPPQAPRRFTEATKAKGGGGKRPGMVRRSLP